MTVHLDRGSASRGTREQLEHRGLRGAIAEKGKPAPVTVGQRWVVERTNAWTNAHKKLVWCTERRAAVIVGRLVRQGWSRYRRDTRPRRRP